MKRKMDMKMDMDVKKYESYLSVMDTQIAIKCIKDFFEKKLSEKLDLVRVSSPLFVLPESGTNDNLDGIQKAVDFYIPGVGKRAEIVQSLAKWKRMALKRYGFPEGKGLYTDMNAIRKDETLDNIHSNYVDQWDWEYVIGKEQRNEQTLMRFAEDIYSVFLSTADYVKKLYPCLGLDMPSEIFMITTEELEDMYPDMTPEEREYAIVKERKAVFLMKIGDYLKSGIKHGDRSPDYDDWQLNGDIIFYDEVLDCALELSSMGIRVDGVALKKQLAVCNCEERCELEYHRQLLQGDLPYTIGGGIGQSRICMFLLKKAHIGEVQSTVWPEHIINSCINMNITLL